MLINTNTLNYTLWSSTMKFYQINWLLSATGKIDACKQHNSTQLTNRFTHQTTLGPMSTTTELLTTSGNPSGSTMHTNLILKR